MAKLTDGKGGTIAKAALPEKGQRLIFDDHRNSPRGFGLRLTAAGGRAFILKYHVEGRERRMTIGDWPTWSLEAARERANELRRMIDAGTDPLDEGRRRRAAPTVAEAVTLYLENMKGLASEQAVIAYFERDVIPVLGKTKLRDITRRDVISLAEDKAKSAPTAARHLLVYIKGFLDWAADREYLPFNPAAGIKPKAIRVNGKRGGLDPVKRGRVLDDDEIRGFWINIEDTAASLLTSLALKLVLVTGQRPGEVAGMHEREIDGDVWTIPAERRRKTDTEHRVPLSPLALDIVERAREEAKRLSRRRGADPTGYIFEARPGESLKVNSMSQAVRRFTAELGNTDLPQWGRWRPHDLRRTCRTGLAACGVSTEIAERVIGHGGKGIEAVYNLHAYDDEKRRALDAWERRLNSVTGTPTDATVINLGRLKA